MPPQPNWLRAYSTHQAVLTMGSTANKLDKMNWDFAVHREREILKMNLLGDYMNILISILPKYFVSMFVEYIKRKMRYT